MRTAAPMRIGSRRREPVGGGILFSEEISGASVIVIVSPEQKSMDGKLSHFYLCFHIDLPGTIQRQLRESRCRQTQQACRHVLAERRFGCRILPGDESDRVCCLGTCAVGRGRYGG